MEYTARMYAIMREAYQKMGELPYAFNLPKYKASLTDTQVGNYFGTAFKDAFREFKFTVADFENQCQELSLTEMYFINRICYHMMKKFRFDVVMYNKFSSSQDGFSIDKTKVYDQFSDLIDKLDQEYKDYVYGSYHHGVLTWGTHGYSWANIDCTRKGV